MLKKEHKAILSEWLDFFGESTNFTFSVSYLRQHTFNVDDAFIKAQKYYYFTILIVLLRIETLLLVKFIQTKHNSSYYNKLSFIRNTIILHN